MKIAISGQDGSGVTATAKIIAKKLRIKRVVYTLRNLAKDEGIMLEEMTKRAEKDKKIDYILDGKNLSLAKGDYVWGSDLAIWISDADLKVWLYAPLGARAERIAKRERISYKSALKLIKDHTKRYTKRYRQAYGMDWDNPFDMAHIVINNETINEQKTAEVIIRTAKLLPFKKQSSIKETKRIQSIIKRCSK